MPLTLARTEQELEELLREREAEVKTFEDLTQQRGTSIPALFSTYYKFIANPSSVSVDTFKRMIDTDDTLGSGTDFLTMCLAARLGEYVHPSTEVTQWMNRRIKELKGGWYNAVRETGSSSWAGFSCQEKVWRNSTEGFVVDRLIPYPATSVLFEVDREGQLTQDGILQYQRSINPLNSGVGGSFWGGAFSSGWTVGFGGNRPDPFARMGDLPYPVRTANSLMYMAIRVPRQKVIHHAFQAQGGFGSPYGRSLLRRAYTAFVAKHSLIQQMLRAMDRKGTPLIVVYAAPNLTVKDPEKVAAAGGGNVRGKDVGMDAAKAAARAFENVHNDTVITLPGKKDQTYNVEAIQVDPNTDHFILAINSFNQAMMRSLLLPPLVFTGGDGAGSYSLGQEHAKTFDKVCDGMLEGIKQALLQEYIFEMMAYNFPRTVWEKEGLGDFTKRELSAEEREKEANLVEKAVNLGVVDTGEMKDLNTCRDKLGFEPTDKPMPKMVLADSGRLEEATHESEKDAKENFDGV